MKKLLSLSSLFILIVMALLPARPAFAQDKVVQMSEQFVGQPLAGYSLIDRTRILKGLMYAAGLSAVPEGTRTAWTEFVKNSLPGLVADLVPSKEPETLEAAANILEINGRLPAPGLDDRLAGWRRWALDPRFIGPENDVGRLGLALVLLHGRPDAAALKYAETLLEAMIDGSRYENEMHRFGSAPAGQALPHRLAHQVAQAPVRTVHDRKLNWMLVTNYKYMTRKAAETAVTDYAFEDALLEHGLLYHSRLFGARLLQETPGPLAKAHYYSVVARFAAENEKGSVWLARAKSQPTPRLVATADEWTKMIARNRTAAYAAGMKKTLADAETALALDVPVYYEPAPNLEERGKTNALAQGVGRKMGPLRAAYLATGDEKWGTAYKDVVMAQVKQFEDYGDFRCHYNLNVPGSWDGLGAVVSYSDAYDVLAARNLLSEAEKDRIILMVREIGRELGWTVGYSNFIVHNAWGRWLGSLGFVVSYWPDIPEAASWRTLVEGRLPFLYSGIDKDGGWWEKTIAYHIFTFDLVEEWFAAAKKLQGVDLFTRELNGRRLDMMLDWLVKMAPPGGEMPLFNDSQKLNLRREGAALRMAKTLGRGDFFKALNLRQVQAAPSEPDTPQIVWRTPGFTSLLLEESGYGIFRNGWEPDDFYGAVKFGEHGGGHGHYDKASIYVQAFGRPWLIDPGYGQRETYKHNTVVVDGRDQSPATGKLLAWHHGGALDMIAVSHRAYEDVIHRRAVFYVKPGTLLVADVLDPLDGRSHAYDWVLQFNSDNGTSGETSWLSRAAGSAIKVSFPVNDRDGTRQLAAAMNVNELPSNYQKMGNDSLYLEIWRGQWSKTADGRAVFAALIEPFGRKEPHTALSQELTGGSFVLEAKDGSGTRRFKWRLTDNTFTYTAPDGRTTDIK
jgi:Heparinase II/III-like protein